MKKNFYPALLEVTTLDPHRLCTRWSTGETLEVDVGEKLRGVPALAKILAPQVFAKAHIAKWGGSVEWFDTEFGADNVYAWAKEHAGEPPHEMLNDWMLRNGLSLTTAAEAIGLSRRMVSYYRTAQKAIPKTVWLACLGWEWQRKQAA